MTKSLDQTEKNAPAQEGIWPFLSKQYELRDRLT